MSVLTALYKSYCYAEANHMVDKTENINKQTVLLPVYHSSKKSMGSNDIIEVTLSEKGKFIKADWVPKDQIIIFPITEKSIIRAGSIISPHPLCDEFSYVSKELDEAKHRAYTEQREAWVEFMEAGNNNQLLRIIHGYLTKETIYMDCIQSLFASSSYEVGFEYEIVINKGESSEKKISLDKTFVTFRVEMEDSCTENLSVTLNQELHNHYINYQRKINSEQLQEQCDISGELTYCVSKHRGLMGNAKLVSISNHNETYYGRFQTGEEIIHIGYEVSQKIHLMLKYLLENNENRRQIGDSCIVLNWFSDDIGNEQGINILQSISPYNISDCVDEWDDDEADEDDELPKSFGGRKSELIHDYLKGKNQKVNMDGKFYLMIVDKISNGRIALKYFNEISRSDLIERVNYWYQSTNWLFYKIDKKQSIQETPSLYRYADMIFGKEYDKGYVECKNTKLKTKTIERLIPCIMERQRLPEDLMHRMFQNLCRRSSYKKTWGDVLSTGCSVIKKYKIDKGKKEEVKNVLDLNEQNRSYLYGRLLAIYEKIELDALVHKAGEGKDRRATNAERFWTTYSKMPARVLLTIEDKVKPYRTSLLKINYKRVNYYDSLISEITSKLRESQTYEQEKNRALTEDFIFGYYGQKQEFYKKKEVQDDMNQNV